MVVHAAAHAALHQGSNGWLLGARVKHILRLVIAVHCASGEAVLRGREDRKHGLELEKLTERSSSWQVEKFAGEKVTMDLGRWGK